MGLLSRKRKRGPTKETPSNTSTPCQSTSEEPEEGRTDETSRISLADISTIQNLDVSRQNGRKESTRLSEAVGCLSQTMDNETEIEDEPMDTNDNADVDEPSCSQWAEQILSQQMPSETQVQRTVKNKTAEEERNALLNVAEVGTIESITLINFMCHENFHLDFGPRINFIVGRNGSGKSAILTAIVLGLGGRAATTSRGKGVASFIKSGETQAKIIIKICNTNERGNGKQGFRTEEFGKSIIVERTLSINGSSTYKIKSATGKVIGDRKDVLEDITRYFNIQVDNPVCVLNQEVSRNFLNTKNARDKYTFFMKATLLEDMKMEYTTAENERSNAEEQLTRKEKVLPQTLKSIKQLEHKVKMFNALQDSKEKFIQLNNEALWAMVYEEQKKLDAIKGQVEKLAQKCAEDSEKVNSTKDTITNLSNDQKNAVARLNGLFTEVQALQTTVNEMKAKCDEEKEKLRLKDRDEKMLKTEYKSMDRDIKDLESKISRLNVQFSDEITNQRRADIAKLREDIECLKCKENGINRSYNEIKESIDQMTEEKLRVSQECNRMAANIGDKKKTLERLEQSRNQRLQRFGRHFPEIVRRIEIAHKKGEFKQKPIGPIGNHIDLKDYSCALAVELCLKRSLFAFCCDNASDANRLKDIMKSVLGSSERMPQIITRPFGQRHDVSRHRVRSDDYKSLLDLMVIKEAAVANALIDQLRIESILFIPDYKEAEDLLMDKRRVPPNCYYAYTAGGDTMYPQTNDSDYKSYANNTNRKSASILVKDVKQHIQALSEEIKVLETERRHKEVELREKSKALEAKQQETGGLDKKKRSIRNEIFEKDAKLKQLEAIGDSPPIEVSTLQEEIQNLIDKKEGLHQRIEVLRTEREELFRTYSEVEEEYKAKKKEYDDKLNEKQPIKDNLEKLKTDLERYEMILKKYEQKLNESTAAKEEEEKKLEAKEKELEEVKDYAIKQTGQPVETNRSTKTITNEIKQMQKFLEEQEVTIGNKDEIYSQYELSLSNYRRVKEEVIALKQHLMKLKKSLKLRELGYKELRNFYTMMTKINFSSILKNKNFIGDLEIYHNNKTTIHGEEKKAKTLEIRVNPKNDEQENASQASVTCYSDTRSLSGGERSFSTVAFILALWESAQSPFKILDEVDVFMDLVTRQLSLDAMIEFAA